MGAGVCALTFFIKRSFLNSDAQAGSCGAIIKDETDEFGKWRSHVCRYERPYMCKRPLNSKPRPPSFILNFEGFVPFKARASKPAPPWLGSILPGLKTYQVDDLSPGFPLAWVKGVLCLRGHKTWLDSCL